MLMAICLIVGVLIGAVGIGGVLLVPAAFLGSIPILIGRQRCNRSRAIQVLCSFW